MDAKTFVHEADRCLDRVATWLEDFDPDELDFATSDGVVTLEFSDGVRFVLNRQAGSRQMWYAAGARAWHYDWVDATWVDDRDGHALYENVRQTVADKLGREIATP